MKSLTVIAALALGLTAQAATAQTSAKASPGVSPAQAQKYVAKYDIVTAKVAEGVKFSNPAPTEGAATKKAPSRMIFQAPERTTK